jgi:two-component system alkaline phosphatase synthesis response regulator PhoP
MSQTVLVVDDEKHIVQLVKLYLGNEGYQVEVAHDGQDALEKVRLVRPDLVVLDLMLPKVSGLEVCRQLRQESDVPIIMLTARDESEDRVAGLELGADDYVTKPFSPRELRARIKALLRRTSPTSEAYSFGEVEVSFARAEVRRGGRAIEITPLELKLLEVFIRRRGRVLTREQLLDAAWEPGVHVTDRAVDAHIVNLRRKIEADPAAPRFVISVRGLGYRFDG